jgi:uncharacterized membrane protein
MKAQREYGLALSWPRITVVFLIDVALLVIASHLPDAWQKDHVAFWVGVGLAALVTIVALVTNGEFRLRRHRLRGCAIGMPIPRH